MFGVWKSAMKNLVLSVIFISLVFGVTLGVCYMLWKFGRKVNYVIAYHPMVKQTIKDIVKEECLK